MEKELYDLMDWSAIEELVYSEAAKPGRLLGPHETPSGTLVTAYIPEARSVSIRQKGRRGLKAMESADDNGFFAILLKENTVPAYTFVWQDEAGETHEAADPYSFAGLFDEEDAARFTAGTHYDVYKKLGAHKMTIDGVDGVYFAVWAPEARRVSVVGDFCRWDGRRYQMNAVGDSGVFELFIPGVKTMDLYKFEIKTRSGQPILKSDPYASFAELRPGTASRVWAEDGFAWSDAAWEEKKTAAKEGPVSIYELHLGSWVRREEETDGDGRYVPGSEFYNYKEIAVRLAEYVKDMGYTHVELMPVMEHPLDESWGYQVTGYYAPTARYGTPDDFRFFINHMHEQGIGVILDWVPAHFPQNTDAMAAFDGTCVYEHADPRKGIHPHWGTLIFNYGRPQVSNFLIANAIYWAKEFHADGIRMDAVASMLYLDYGRNPGEWIPNIYGGHENLEAAEFLKHLNSVFKKLCPGAMLIAEESTAWPKVTGSVEDDGLGFDYKWNMGWMNDFTEYLRTDPYFRRGVHGKLTFGMLYAYSEDFVLVFSHDEVVHGKGSMLMKLPGDTYEKKAANLRAAYGFMYGHPGKKLLFMGQEFAQVSEWNEKEELPWDILKFPIHRQMRDFVRDLNALYTSRPSLYDQDFVTEGFRWMDCMNSAENIVSFIRTSKDGTENLLFICNFAPVPHRGFVQGVPFAGKYKEILNSDDEKYGGSGMINKKQLSTQGQAANGCEDSIVLDLGPMCAVVFECRKTAAKKAGAKTAGQEDEKKTAGKTARQKAKKEADNE